MKLKMDRLICLNGIVLSFAFVVSILAREKIAIRSVFPDRTKPPGLKAPQKCWWAKEITPDYHIAGRLTERQIKYAAEAGFKSVVSLFTFLERDTFGEDVLPTTEEARKIAEDVVGLKFASILPSRFDNFEWASVDAVERLTQVLPTLPKPVLLHCQVGYTITFVTLLYLANQTRHDLTFTSRITRRDFDDISAAMGLDFSESYLNVREYKEFASIPEKIIDQVTGESAIENPARTKTVPEYWLFYWVAHPVYANYFMGGQIAKSHIAAMERVGFTSVINLRSGITLHGKPNQEEVNLLNIQQDTGTYAGSGKDPRQSKPRLEETRIDSKRPNYFISADSDRNYESRNYAEFGDEVGYQETFERAAFVDSKLDYYHFPVDKDGPCHDFLDKHLKTIVEIGRKGPVLLHCSTGKRSAYVAVLAAAMQHDRDLLWALQRLRELGFDITQNESSEIYDLYELWLVTKRNPKEEL